MAVRTMVQTPVCRYDFHHMTTPETTSLYTDVRLVALYDALNPFAADTAFYLDLAATLPRARSSTSAAAPDCLPVNWHGVATT